MKCWSALLVACATLLHAGPVPQELDKALHDYRPEGGFGYAFTQTASADGKTRVEVFDPSRPPGQQWDLVSIDGAKPATAQEAEYHQARAMRSNSGTAPNVKDELDRDTCTLLDDDGERVRYRFHLKPTDASDTSAPHMQVTFTLHRPTGAIEVMDLASFEAFSPVFGVKVKEARTVVTYSLPADGRPALLEEVTTKVRGRAFVVRNLDSDLKVTYSDYRYAGKKPPAPPAEEAKPPATDTK